MLHQLKLTMFRQHEDRTFNFTKGLNAIKGANEAGKSTMIEALIYALFGAKALSESLSDVVTWGHKESELAVEVTIEVMGTLYHIKRAKSGAELNYVGGTVTGQNEVSAFSANLLGGDHKAMGRLILSTQNDLRGALEQGPTAVASQIEDLADFDLFDRIISKAQEKWMLGSPALLDDRIKQLDLQIHEVPPLNTSVLEEEFEAHGNLITIGQAEITGLQVKHREASAAYDNAATIERMRQGIVNDLERAKTTRDNHKASLIRYTAAATADTGSEKLEGLRALLVDAESRKDELVAYQAFKAYVYPETFWDEPKESLIKAIADNDLKLSGHNRNLLDLRTQSAGYASEIKVRRSHITTTLVCPTCRQEFKNKAEMEANNALLQTEIDNLVSKQAELDLRIAETQRQTKEIEGDLLQMKTILRDGEKYVTLSLTYQKYIEADTSNYPPRLAWRGQEPSERQAPDVGTIQRQIRAIETAESDRITAIANSESMRKTLEDDEAHIQRLTGQLLEFGDSKPIGELKEAVSKLANEISIIEIRIDRAKQERQRIDRQILEAQAKHKIEVERMEETKGRLSEALYERKKLDFNNGLLKKIKAARPVIADKLWSMVLTSSSTMFSQMREEKSVVTKTSEGFKINGKSMSSYSGSTKDILGLAIRVSLIRTFMPGVELMVLDEPAHGCDANRTAAMLGYLGTVGFDQTIVISHEPATEAAADHLIQL